MMKEEEFLLCPNCQGRTPLVRSQQNALPQFCCYCGHHITQESPKESPSSYTERTLISEHIPKKDEVQFTVDTYQILGTLGKGGMGEVFLAYDTICGRRIALKRIRDDLDRKEILQKRFLKEARVTSQLTHPAVVPIYGIHDLGETYYTMPYIQGDTLKQILRNTRLQEKQNEPLDHIGGSIPALVRIFLSVCQAIAYAHSKGVLHRDIKPENVIVGQYGEVMILDWGLAKLMQQKEESFPDEASEETSPELTRAGKIVGTISYMAPERAKGKDASVQTEIYALGVILYQILTLRLPFRRKSLADFREKAFKETFKEPCEVAPYRDVPRMLSRICDKCLQNDPGERYPTVDELIYDLENFLEGRSEWFPFVTIDVQNKEFWEFQENVLLTEHMAITRETEISDWVSLMISKASLPENMRMEARIRFGPNSHGIGFLLKIPEPAERIHLNDGYCLWLASDKSKSTKLLRSTVEVMHTPEVFLQRGVWYRIRLEKVENNLHFYLNDVLQFTYMSHLPLAGTHMGLLARDDDYEIEDFVISAGSQNIKVSCLAVPDAFLAHKDYEIALHEYRRIGYSFPGRAEGREALFRAGVTLLEQGRNSQDPEERNQLWDAALEEFEKLHQTPGAPLEYLGKALIYEQQKDYEEELKCFQLAFRRYPTHPLLPLLYQQLLFRMHQSSHYHRIATYYFILVATRHLPKRLLSNTTTKRLFSNLQKHWEPLWFIEKDPAWESSFALSNDHFALQLAFWLDKPYYICEIINDFAHWDPLPAPSLNNALYSLIEMGAWEIAGEKMEDLKAIFEEKGLSQQQIGFDPLSTAILSYKTSLGEAFDALLSKKKPKMSRMRERVLFHLCERALDENQTSCVHRVAQCVPPDSLTTEGQVRLDSYRIWAYLLDQEWDAAQEVLSHYPLQLVTQPDSPLHSLYGCLLVATEGKAIADIHFSGILEDSFPRSTVLLSHFLTGKISEDSPWFKRAFRWEKKQLFRQLVLYYHCLGEKDKEQMYRNLLDRERFL